MYTDISRYSKVLIHCYRCRAFFKVYIDYRFYGLVWLFSQIKTIKTKIKMEKYCICMILRKLSRQSSRKIFPTGIKISDES